MADIVLHPITREQLEALIAHPSHAMLLTGPSGSGKAMVARYLAARLLGKSPEEVTSQAYVRIIAPDKNSSIALDTIRALNSFMSRKVPGNQLRLLLLEDAHTMTQEAQNALLKMLEEPPPGTSFILTSISERAVLPTLASRSTVVNIKRPVAAKLVNHFQTSGFAPADISKAELMSGGLPGLMAALLEADTEHPLVKAAATARDIVRKTGFERLTLVDELARQKEYCLDVLAMLRQMSQVALRGAKTPATQNAWQRILAASYRATEQLQGSAQPKLVLTNLMLSL